MKSEWARRRRRTDSGNREHCLLKRMFGGYPVYRSRLSKFRNTKRTNQTVRPIRFNQILIIDPIGGLVQT